MSDIHRFKVQRGMDIIEQDHSARTKEEEESEEGKKMSFIMRVSYRRYLSSTDLTRMDNKTGFI